MNPKRFASSPTAQHSLTLRCTRTVETNCAAKLSGDPRQLWASKMRVTKTCRFHSRAPLLEQEGWTRPKEKCCEASFERSGRGGRSWKGGRNAIPAILCERPPRRFAPPLLYQEGSSHVRTIFAIWTVLPGQEGQTRANAFIRERRGGRSSESAVARATTPSAAIKGSFAAFFLGRVHPSCPGGEFALPRPSSS